MNFLYGDTTRFYIKTALTHSLTETIRASTIRLRVLARHTVQGAVANWRYESERLQVATVPCTVPARLMNNGKAQISKRRNERRNGGRSSS